MRTTRRLILSRAALAAALPACVTPAIAQGTEFPNRPVRLVVPFAAGGSTDIVARIVAEKMAPALGQPVVIENRAGAAGNIAAEHVAASAPDGYTLLHGTVSNMTINPSLYRTMKVDPLRDLAPITLLVTNPNILVVHPSMNVTDFAGFVAALKARPGTYSYASPGAGTSNHLGTELLLRLTGTEATHIPYRGTGAVMSDLLAGRVQFMVDTMPTALPMVRQGRLVAIGVTSANRATAAPDIPALAEFVPGFEATSWNGLVAPAGVAAPIIAILNRAAVTALRDPGVIARLADLGATATPTTPEAFGALMRTETTRWAEVVKSSGATLD